MAKNPIIETPRGKIILNKNNEAKLVWNTARFNGGGKNGGGSGTWQGRFFSAQEFVDSQVLNYSDPFTPHLTGTLIKTGDLGTEIGSGLVEWVAPYAKAQYYMSRKEDSSKDTNRGPHWFERMKNQYGGLIIEGARRIAGKGSK